MTTRLVERLLWKSASVASPILRSLDHRLIERAEARSTAPPVFIIGAPRSGTTLLYQVLTQRYDLAYFNNLTAPFYRTPVVAFWLSHRLLPRCSQPNYISSFGRTRGWRGPHEAGDFWYRWFPQGERVYVPCSATSPRALDELYQTVHAMSAVSGQPVVFKNVYNSMRIAPITEALPRAAFLVSRRDPLDTAQSILNSRIKTQGSKKRWWSVPPKEIDAIKQHPYWQQVAEQVYYTYQQITDDRRRLGNGRFFDVSYEALCTDPGGALAQIAHFLENAGVPLRVKGKVADHFYMSAGRQVGLEDYERIHEAVARLWGR